MLKIKKLTISTDIADKYNLSEDNRSKKNNL